MHPLKRGNSSVGRAQPCQGWGREFEPRFPLYAKIAARMVESVDTRDLKSLGYCSCAGSSPASSTKAHNRKVVSFLFIQRFSSSSIFMGSYRKAVGCLNLGIYFGKSKNEESNISNSSKFSSKGFNLGIKTLS